MFPQRKTTQAVFDAPKNAGPGFFRRREATRLHRPAATACNVRCALVGSVTAPLSICTVSPGAIACPLMATASAQFFGVRIVLVRAEQASAPDRNGRGVVLGKPIAGLNHRVIRFFFLRMDQRGHGRIRALPVGLRRVGILQCALTRCRRG